MEAVKKVRGTCSVLFKDVLLLAGGLAVAAIAQPARAIPLELNYDNGAFIAIDNVVGDSDPRVDYMTSSYLSGNTQALPVLAYDNSPVIRSMASSAFQATPLSPTSVPQLTGG